MNEDFTPKQKESLRMLCDDVSKQTTEKIQHTVEMSVQNTVPAAIRKEFKSYGEDMSGKDVTKIEDRKQIRQLVDYTERRYKNSQVAQKAWITEGVKNVWAVIMSVAVTVLMYLGWTK